MVPHQGSGTVITPYHGRRDPFALRSNAIYFHDWRYVHHGDTGWVTEDGRYLGLWSPTKVPELRWAGRDTPRGIRLEAVRARKSGPVLKPDEPWEGVIFAPSLMLDDGRYRMWYESVPPEHVGGGEPGHRNLLLYAESKDGRTWEKPTIGRVEYGGSTENNIVYGGGLLPDRGYHGGSVFLDPSCPPEERYKVIHLGFLSDDDFARYRKERREDGVDPLSEGTRGRHGAVFGATSSDGIVWEPISDPLVLQSSDTQNTAYYDEFLGKYVAFLRTWVLRKRSIGRTESTSFKRFPLPETIIWPGPELEPSDLWYSNAKTSYPGAPDYHLLFPKRWNVAEDRFFVHMAVSPDGIMWAFPPGSQVLVPGERGEWDTGGADVGCGMVALPDDRIGVPFIGWRVPHKYTRDVPLGEIGIASWDRGRLVALKAEGKGEFRTTYITFEGERLHLNLRTTHAGEVRVGVVGEDHQEIPGRGIDECDPASGNCLAWEVTWNGEPSIGHEPGSPVAFRLRMASAELYAMEFK
jgi:hypothetical protein